MVTSVLPLSMNYERPEPSAPVGQSVKPIGNLAQIMRGIYFPSANLIFDVQQRDPTTPHEKSETDGSVTGKYADVYSGWESVENAAVSLVDSGDLLLNPDRLCQNGRPVPARDPNYQRFAREMRAAGLVVLRAARLKDQALVSEATSNLADACSGCHRVYRRGRPESMERCTAPLNK